MTTLNQIVLFLFGASWKTTLIGIFVASGIEIATQLEALPGYGWHILAFGILALARAAKDSGTTGGTAVASNSTIVPQAIAPPK